MTDDRFAARGWTGLGAGDLGAAALVPTMLNLEEQVFYLWLARDWAEGQGTIVDLGSFAGGSAACLAEGVRQAERDQVVHGYDKFELGKVAPFLERHAAYMARPPASTCGLTPPPLPEGIGQDLLPVARHYLAPWGDAVRLHKGQIEKMGWDAGPIELLVMDASKTAATMDRMSATFFPHLVPGKSLVVQQDFFWWQQPWIAAQMALLAEYFEPVAFVPNHSVSFLCTRAVPAEVLAGLDVAGRDDAALVAAIGRMHDILSGFGVGGRIDRMVAGLRANPGERKAFRFKAKPGRG